MDASRRDHEPRLELFGARLLFAEPYRDGIRSEDRRHAVVNGGDGLIRLGRHNGATPDPRAFGRAPVPYPGERITAWRVDRRGGDGKKKGRDLAAPVQLGLAL